MQLLALQTTDNTCMFRQRDEKRPEFDLSQADMSFHIIKHRKQAMGIKWQISDNAVCLQDIRLCFGSKPWIDALKR